MNGCKRRIESLDVADLQHELLTLGEAHQLLGLRERGGNRLFDQHMNAAEQQLTGDLKVQHRGRGDDRGIGHTDQIAEVSERLRTRFGGDLFARRSHGINDRHQTHLGKVGCHAGMKAAQVSGTNHG